MPAHKLHLHLQTHSCWGNNIKQIDIVNEWYNNQFFCNEINYTSMLNIWTVNMLQISASWLTHTDLKHNYLHFSNKSCSSFHSKPQIYDTCDHASFCKFCHACYVWNVMLCLLCVTCMFSYLIFNQTIII